MIVLKDICKTLSGREALRNISFHIAEKEHVGIIGLNGAGKTTLLNTVAGILKPDSGLIRIFGEENPMAEKNTLRNLVYLSGTRSQLWENLKIKDSLDHCIRMYRLDKREAAKRLDELEETFEIKEFMDSPPCHLSLGERMRCELVYGLLSQPKLLLLDEVMNGLDISFKHKIMEYFKRCGKENPSAMLYASNQLSEVEQLCERVILIHQGSVLFDGRTAQIIGLFSPCYRIEVRFSGNLPDFEDLPLEKYRLDGDLLTIDYDTRKIETVQILKHLMEKCSIRNIKILKPDLEATVQKIYGGVNGKYN